MQQADLPWPPGMEPPVDAAIQSTDPSAPGKK